MKFYLDEDMSQAAAEALRSQSIEALSCHEAGNDGLTDNEQLAFAAAQGYMIVSYNRNDFLALGARWFSESKAFPGITILLEKRFPRRDIGRQVKGLVHFALNSPATVENAVVFLSAPPEA